MNRLEVNQVSKRFGRRVLFSNLSFACDGAESVAITGPNGSGKSTLLRIVAGVLSPTAGKVRLLRDGKVTSEHHRPGGIGFVAPYLNMYDGLTLSENLDFLSRVRNHALDDARRQTILKSTGLQGRGNDLVSTFSSGMKQRARYAAALIGKPSLYLFDEPTTNLDEEGRAMVAGLIERCLSEEAIVVVATNVAEEAARCDREIGLPV